MIHVEDLTKSYGSGEVAVTAVDGISFEIEQGEIVGLLGPNGAGKTTTIKSMLSLVFPDGGYVEVDGVDVHDGPAEARSRVGAILEGARNIYWRLTPMENLAFFAALGGEEPGDLRDRHEQLLELFGLADKADTVVNHLSRGMKQKVSLATTLARNVDVVFMDEPTMGLDIETELELRSELSRLAERESVTIVLSSHDMDVIETVCDRVIVLNDGSIVADDDIDDLFEVFRTRDYEVRIDGPLPEELRANLGEAVDAECIEEGGMIRIHFTAAEDADLREVLTLLDDADKSVRGIQSMDPDLEQIFLKLTEGATSDIESQQESDNEAASSNVERRGETAAAAVEDDANDG